MGEENLALKNHTHANYIDVSKVANNLVTTDASMVLAAAMGTYLNERLGAVREMYRTYLDPGFFTLECIPENPSYEHYFASSYPPKFYIKSLNENSSITLNSQLNVIRRTGNMADIGHILISTYENYYGYYTYQESHGTSWWTYGENLVESGYIIHAAKSFKISVSDYYYSGEFGSIGGVLQKFEHEPGQTGGEHDSFYATRITANCLINS